MESKGVSDAHEIASIAQNELGDLEVIDGGEPAQHKKLFYRLKQFFRGLRREENGMKNRELDSEGGNGYIPSHDIASTIKQRNPNK